MKTDKSIHVLGSSEERKAQPVCTGVIDYFPDALLEVAKVSLAGNAQHGITGPLRWAKEKSRDEADALVRHLIDRGKLDHDGLRHSAKLAWRALALLQREIEQERGWGYDEKTNEWCWLGVEPQAEAPEHLQPAAVKTATPAPEMPHEAPAEVPASPPLKRGRVTLSLYSER